MRQLPTGHQMTQKLTTIFHRTFECLQTLFFHTLIDAIFIKKKRETKDK